MSMMKPPELYRLPRVSHLFPLLILVVLLATVSCSTPGSSGNGIGSAGTGIGKPEKSPHIPGDKNTCVVCHKEDAVQNGKQQKIAASDIEPRCISCHNSLTSKHYRGINPFTDPLALQQYTTPDKILADGRPGCIACHSPHAAEGDDKDRLLKEYFRLAAIARSINPHGEQLMCLSCHTAAPVAGQPNLVEDGDFNAICNRCHTTEFARKEIHPVGIIPSKHVQIPSDMPLQDGHLTCETCHRSSLQPGDPCQTAAGEEDKKFLRRGGLTRNEFCFLCHIEETYKRLNPHIQVDDKGRILEETCLFCHATRPDINILGLEHVVFLMEDPDEACKGCHHGFETKHPSGGNHLTEPRGTILRALETAVERIGVELPLYNGKIVCATCHNPHSEGVIKISAAAEGSQRENKLRLMPGIMQCVGCHWDKL